MCTLTLTNVLTPLQHTEKALLRRWCMFTKIKGTYTRRAANVSKLAQKASAIFASRYFYLWFQLESHTLRLDKSTRTRTNKHTHTRTPQTQDSPTRMFFCADCLPQGTTSEPGKEAAELRGAIPPFRDSRGRYGRRQCGRHDHASAVNPPGECSTAAYLRRSQCVVVQKRRDRVFLFIETRCA